MDFRATSDSLNLYHYFYLSMNVRFLPLLQLREKFCYSIRMVRFVVRLSKCLKFYAWNKGQNQQSLEQVREGRREGGREGGRAHVFISIFHSSTTIVQRMQNLLHAKWSSAKLTFLHLMS